jgi:TusA-related sulfurtransferase
MQPDATLDITEEVCPMTFVRTRLALDRLPAGALLAVRLQGEEPLRNVPASAARLGHEVTVTTAPDGTAEVLIRKAGQAKPA